MNYNTDNILVSIIVPVYNVEKYIIRCIDSILKQTYRHIEVILIDDCGKDNSIDVARDYVANNPQQDISFSIVSHEENKGPSAARNTGILNSTGKYLYFLDSDDELDSNCILLLLNSIEKYQAEVAIGNNTIISNINDVRYIDSQLKAEFISDNNTIFNSYLDGLWYNVAWNKLIRRDFIISKNLMFEVGYIHEDELWGYLLAAQTSKLSIVKEYTYKYYINPGSIMSKSSQYRMTQFIDIIHIMKIASFRLGVQNNPHVKRYFFYKILTIINSLDRIEALNKEIYQKVLADVFFNTIAMALKGTIPLKECIANFFIHLPYCCYKPYCRFMTLLSNFSKH